jgi:hypothetical protein
MQALVDPDVLLQRCIECPEPGTGDIQHLPQRPGPRRAQAAADHFTRRHPPGAGAALVLVICTCIRSVDTRRDLYSLGVTLYQMLTVVLLFVAADPLK